MRIAICDDEKIFLNKVTDLVEKWADQHRIDAHIYKFSNGDDLLRGHADECMDLIILDVIMPLLNGIDTARELRNKDSDVPVIFLTSAREFAVESYEVDAFYYLLKPVNETKFFDVLDRFLETTDLKKSTFTAKTPDGFQKINLDDIFYLEAQNKLVEIVMSNGSHIEVHELFSKCEEFFTPEKGFFKCHRSYIVNLDHIVQFTKTEIVTGNVSIPISRNRYNEFKDAYFAHMFN